uniref:USP domain-containing protein n=1 Tax=Lepisosteus oculatus TaxID=7918 RepID=W5M7E4_LEPOC
MGSCIIADDFTGQMNDSTEDQDPAGQPVKGYNGLKNQGATCYLNTVLQVFFMTPEFRTAINGMEEESEGSVSFQLRTLFEGLEQGHACVETKGIVKSLGIVNVYEQRDAEEFFQRILNAVSRDASKFFQGTLIHTTKCLKCNFLSEEDKSQFLDIPLSVNVQHNELYNIEDALEEFFRTSQMTGEDQLYCDNCEDKTDTEMGCCLGEMPDILSLHLKRFDYDFYQESYVKIECPVNIPLTIQFKMKPQKYELYALCNHIGSYRGGHYVANIKSLDDGKWYIFDDTEVKFKSMPSYQEPEQHENDYQIIMKTSIHYIRSQDAYLLLYRVVSENGDHDATDGVPNLQTGQAEDSENCVGQRSNRTDKAPRCGRRKTKKKKKKGKISGKISGKKRRNRK